VYDRSLPADSRKQEGGISMKIFVITFNKGTKLVLAGFTGSVYFDEWDKEDYPNEWAITIDKQLTWTNTEDNDEATVDIEDGENELRLIGQDDDEFVVELNRRRICTLPSVDFENVEIYGDFNTLDNGLFKDISIKIYREGLIW